MSETPSPPPPEPTPPLDYGTTATGYTGPEPDKDAKNMGMLCHLLGIFTVWLGPLIIWLLKKDSSPFVDDQGKEALNFQITAFIAILVCIPLVPVFCIGAILIAAIQITRIVLGILATVAATKGVAYRYPLTLRLIK